MKRWNGWGNLNTDYPLPESGLAYLKGKLGPLETFQDVPMENILPAIPNSRLPANTLVRIDPETRLRHTRGQSLPDLVALSSGHIEAFPDGVAFPENEEDIRDLLTYAQRSQTSNTCMSGHT